MLTLMATLVYLIKPRAPQYAYSVYSIQNDSLAFLVFLAMEIFTKSINVTQLFLSQAWFLCSVAFLTIGLSGVRYLKINH